MISNRFMKIPHQRTHDTEHLCYLNDKNETDRLREYFEQILKVVAAGGVCRRIVPLVFLFNRDRLRVKGVSFGLFDFRNLAQNM